MANDRNYNNQRNLGAQNRYDNKPQGPSQEQIISLFKPEWITCAIAPETIDFCKEVAQFLVNNQMSASFIRNIFGELKRIETKGFDNCKTDFYLLRPKVAYSVARSEKNVRLFQEVYDRMEKLVTNGTQFKNLVNIEEAIIAYHKAFGGK